MMNHGESGQVERIAKSVSTYTEIGSINAILSFGSTSSQVLSGGLNITNFLYLMIVDYFLVFLKLLFIHFKQKISKIIID
jgi:hypothetical protein